MGGKTVEISFRKETVLSNWDLISKERRAENNFHQFRFVADQKKDTLNQHFEYKKKYIKITIFVVFDREKEKKNI